MKIKFQALASGSNGNCGILTTPEGALLIEAGITRKKLLYLLRKAKISPADLQGILISHSHSDHCRGLPVITESLNVPIISSKGTREGFRGFQSLDSRWKHITKKSVTINSSTALSFGAFQIHSLPTVHDALGANGFFIEYNDIGISIITDTGRLLPHHLDAINKSNIVLLEMNHDIAALYRSHRTIWLKKRIRGTHLDNGQTIDALSQIDTESKVLMFGHLSGECNSPKLVKNELAKWGKDIEDFPWDCYICRRNSPGPLITLSGGDKLSSSENSLNLNSLKETYKPPKDLLSYFS